MSYRSRRATLGAACIPLVAGLLLGSAPPASAATSNGVTVELSGGDATAVTACINLALTQAELEKGGLTAQEKKQLERDSKRQANRCKDKARANGGNVQLRGVDVKVMEMGPNGALVESSMDLDGVTITLAGGDATALAACVNAVEGDASAVRQENDCKNSARARAGKVRLQRVEIILVTGTGGTAALDGAQLSLGGGDATAISACVNAALDVNASTSQRNQCTNKASADGGDLRLRNVTLEVKADGSLDLENVSVTLTGGDATAIAACVNIVEGDATGAEQRNKCRNAARARGGDLILTKVTILVMLP